MNPKRDHRAQWKILATKKNFQNKMVLLSISADGDFAMFVSLVEFRLPFPGGDPNFV